MPSRCHRLAASTDRSLLSLRAVTFEVHTNHEIECQRGTLSLCQNLEVSLGDWTAVGPKPNVKKLAVLTSCIGSIYLSEHQGFAHLLSLYVAHSIIANVDIYIGCRNSLLLMRCVAIARLTRRRSGMIRGTLWSQVGTKVCLLVEMRYTTACGSGED